MHYVQTKKKTLITHNQLNHYGRSVFVAQFARCRSLRLQWTMSNFKDEAFLHINTAPADRDERRREKSWQKSLQSDYLVSCTETICQALRRVGEERQDKTREREVIKSWREQVPGESMKKKTKAERGGKWKQTARETKRQQVPTDWFYK